MTCKGCGLCCKVWIVKGKDFKLAGMRKNFIKTIKFEDCYYSMFESECKHLRGNRCMVYDRRPEQCKKFPEGKEMLAVWKLLNPDCGMI